MRQLTQLLSIFRWRVHQARLRAVNKVLSWQVRRARKEKTLEKKRANPSYILKQYNPNVVRDSSHMVKLTPRQLERVPDRYKNGNKTLITDGHIVLSQLLIDGAWIFAQPINKDKFINNIQKSLIKFPFLGSIIEDFNEQKAQIRMVHNNTGVRLNIASFIASDQIYTNEAFEKEFHKTLRPGLRDQYFDLTVTPRSMYAEQDPLLILQLTYFNDRENTRRIKDFKFKDYCVLSFQFAHGIGDAFSVYQYLKYLSYLMNIETAMQLEGVDKKDELKLKEHDGIIQIGKEFDLWQPNLCDLNPKFEQKVIDQSKFFNNDKTRNFKSKWAFKSFYDRLVKDQAKALDIPQGPVSSVLPTGLYDPLIGGLDFDLVEGAKRLLKGSSSNNNSMIKGEQLEEHETIKSEREQLEKARDKWELTVPGVRARKGKGAENSLVTFDSNYPNHPIIRAFDVNFTSRMMQKNVNSFFKYFTVRPPLFQSGGWYDQCYELHLPRSFLNELKTNILVNGQGRGIDNITALETTWAYFGFLFNKYLYDFELNHIFSNISLRDRYSTYNKQDFGNLITGMNVDLTNVNKYYNEEKKDNPSSDYFVHIFESFKEINYIVDMACIFRGYYNFFVRHPKSNDPEKIGLNEQILHEWWYFNQNIRNHLMKDGHYQLLLSSKEMADGKYVQFNEIKSLQMYKNYQFGILNQKTQKLCTHSWQYIYGTYYNANQFVVLPVSPRDPKGGFIVYIRFDTKLLQKWKQSNECMELVRRFTRRYNY